MMNSPQPCDPLQWCCLPVWYLSVASLVLELLNPYPNASDSAKSTHVVRDGACQERGLHICFWCESQPPAWGRRECQGCLQASRVDNHDCDCEAFFRGGRNDMYFPSVTRLLSVHGSASISLHVWDPAFAHYCHLRTRNVEDGCNFRNWCFVFIVIYVTYVSQSVWWRLDCGVTGSESYVLTVKSARADTLMKSWEQNRLMFRCTNGFCWHSLKITGVYWVCWQM